MFLIRSTPYVNVFSSSDDCINGRGVVFRDRRCQGGMNQFGPSSTLSITMSCSPHRWLLSRITYCELIECMMFGHRKVDCVNTCIATCPEPDNA